MRIISSIRSRREQRYIKNRMKYVQELIDNDIAERDRLLLSLQDQNFQTEYLGILDPRGVNRLHDYKKDVEERIAVLNHAIDHNSQYLASIDPDRESVSLDSS